MILQTYKVVSSVILQKRFYRSNQLQDTGTVKFSAEKSSAEDG